MDLARLLHYLEYRLDEAEVAYRAIILEWGGISGSNRLIAAAMRNLAECIVARAAPGDRNALQEAEGLLTESERRLRETPEEPLRAEIVYEMAKLAERRGERPASIQLLESCIPIARTTGNGMVAAIAEARLFWHKGPFDAEKWRALERDLAPYLRHGWAIRTSLNGRIRAAKRFAEMGLLEEALQLLRRNRDDLAARPGYNRGTDRRRVMKTLAGLVTLSNDPEERQDARKRFAALPWGLEWLAERGLANIEDAWLEVE